MLCHSCLAMTASKLTEFEQPEYSFTRQAKRMTESGVHTREILQPFVQSFVESNLAQIIGEENIDTMKNTIIQAVLEEDQKDRIKPFDMDTAAKRLAEIVALLENMARVHSGNMPRQKQWVQSALIGEGIGVLQKQNKAFALKQLVRDSTRSSKAIPMLLLTALATAHKTHKEVSKTPLHRWQADINSRLPGARYNNHK
eukprot:3460681-Rhodomonas_salina.2